MKFCYDKDNHRIIMSMNGRLINSANPTLLMHRRVKDAVRQKQNHTMLRLYEIYDKFASVITAP